MVGAGSGTIGFSQAGASFPATLPAAGFAGQGAVTGRATAAGAGVAITVAGGAETTTVVGGGGTTGWPAAR